MLVFAREALRAMRASTSPSSTSRVALRQSLLPLAREARRRGLNIPALVDAADLAITTLNSEDATSHINDMAREEMLVALTLAWYDG